MELAFPAGAQPLPIGHSVPPPAGEAASLVGAPRTKNGRGRTSPIGTGSRRRCKERPPGRKSACPAARLVSATSCRPREDGHRPSTSPTESLRRIELPQAAAEARAGQLARHTARLTFGDRAELGIRQEVRRKHSGLSRPAGQAAVDRNSGASTTHGRRGGKSSGESCLLPASERRPTGGAPGSWRAEPPAHVGHRLRRSTT